MEPMEALEKLIEELQIFLNKNVVEDIRKYFKYFNEIQPATFESYQEIVNYEISFHNVANNLINEGLVKFQESGNSKIKDDNRQYFSSLNSLKLLASKMAYSKRIDFIRDVLDSSHKDSSHKKELLFSNIMFTEEEINKRYRKLALYFHPDKTGQPNTPYYLQSEHKKLGDRLFRFGLNFKESLLDELKNTLKNEGWALHEKFANHLWKITIDYRNAAKGQLNNLKLLNKDDIKELTSEGLKRHSVNYGLLAYKEYRAACKIVDKAKQLKDQVRLRGNMALCLYVSNRILEAQLFALSAINLHLKNSNLVTHELNEAKKIFDKVRGRNVTDETNKPATEIKLKDNFDNKALVKLDREISFFEKKSQQRSIDDDMKKIITDLMFNADRSLVRYEIPEEEILQVKEHAKQFKIIGGMTMVVGGGLVSTVTMAAIEEFGLAIALGFLGPIGLIFGITTVGLGLWGGYKLLNKGAEMTEVPVILEKLNDIMREALKAHDEGDHQKFIDVLSKEYKKDTSLIYLKDHADFINPNKIVEILLSYRFRPDGVAYLLTLLGEVLSIGKIKIYGKTTNDLKMFAKIVYTGVKDPKLYEEAKKLDDRIREIKENIKFKNLYNKIIDFIFLKTEYSNIAQVHLDDAEEMPFQSRLEEVQNIARINLAIFDIIDGGKEEFERAIETIKTIRDKCRRISELRLEILEDFLWVICGEEIPQESYPQNQFDNKSLLA
ncbi:4668_t:CDS:1 [Funneliformis mosseae]|uniref:4668_t:CDS:1 n=1 Tax=Funneliformis mosseae TaxID=27381 RepID=A0A9N8WF84_FUNMO|nr:4668_t:CDS:1 [Funneliformis mosseae]